MNKFGLLDAEDDLPSRESALTDKLSMFPPVRPRLGLDLVAIDAAAAQHGFVSREVAPPGAKDVRRRRRAIPSEPTRHLAIRLNASSYERFVAYADRHKLTYHDALTQLMDANES